MASQFQNRLIGTIILVIAGVIFLPDLFDGQKLHYKEQFDSFPLKPSADDSDQPTDIPVADNVKTPTQSKEDETYTVEDTPTPVKPSVTKPAVKPQPKPVVKPQPKPIEKPKPAVVTDQGLKKSGWMIQLGTFGDFKNASALVAKLRLNGYQAHLLPKNPQPGQYVKVVVGPDASKDVLLSKVESLKQLTGLNGRLYQFTPTKP